MNSRTKPPQIQFFQATSKAERQAINTFLQRHNSRGMGSRTGYVAYYAASSPADGRPLLDRLVAAAKICPLHTPQAARFFAGEAWRHVYVLQRLAARRPPRNLLSQFLAWVLGEVGQDKRIHYLATYADTSTFNQETGLPHSGAIYRACGAVYCGKSEGGIEGFIRDGQRHSLRRGPRTYRLSELRAINARARLEGRPQPVQLIHSAGMHRFCWAVGLPLVKAARRKALEKRMKRYEYIKAFQPRLLAALKKAAAWLALKSKCFQTSY